MNADYIRSSTDHYIRNSDKYKRIETEINKAIKIESYVIVGLCEEPMSSLLRREGFGVKDNGNGECTISWYYEEDS